MRRPNYLASVAASRSPPGSPTQQKNSYKRFTGVYLIAIANSSSMAGRPCGVVALIGASSTTHPSAATLLTELVERGFPLENGEHPSVVDEGLQEAQSRVSTRFGYRFS